VRLSFLSALLFLAAVGCSEPAAPDAAPAPQPSIQPDAPSSSSSVAAVLPEVRYYELSPS